MSNVTINKANRQCRFGTVRTNEIQRLKAVVLWHFEFEKKNPIK